MATAETNVVHECMMSTSKLGSRLFKNVRGGFYPIGAVKPLVAAVLRGAWAEAKAIAKSMRVTMAGLLVPGSSDLIGFTPVVITQEMVGTTVAVFTAIEAKAETKASPDQKNFMNFVRQNGGLAGVAHNAAEADKIVLAKPHEVR